jgi:hypothetical protein
MDKGADGLKVAAAQLQTTYVKAVSDAAKEVRSEAAPGLGKLLNFGARVDFIIKVCRPNKFVENDHVVFGF